MIRTTTRLHYNSDGQITSQIVEQEEIQPDTITVGANYPNIGYVPPNTIKVNMDPLIYNGVQTDKPMDTVRSTYRELSDAEQNALRDMKYFGELFIDAIKLRTPMGRMQSLALTRAEEAVMWATKAITT